MGRVRDGNDVDHVADVVRNRSKNMTAPSEVGDAGLHGTWVVGSSIIASLLVLLGRCCYCLGVVSTSGYKTEYGLDPSREDK